MLDQFKDGIVGLALFLGSWLSPGTDTPGLYLRSIDIKESAVVVEAGMELAWNEQLSELVDAGIPLQFAVRAESDKGDTYAFIRTLTYTITRNEYLFSDSVLLGTSAAPSKSYDQILVALRDYRKWIFVLAPGSTRIRVEAELLPALVPRLNRKVDISAIWGQKRLSHTFDLSPHLHTRKSAKAGKP